MFAGWKFFAYNSGINNISIGIKILDTGWKNNMQKIYLIIKNNSVFSYTTFHLIM